MKKEELIQTNKILRLFFSVLVGIFVILATGYIFAYSYGFRLTLDRDNPIEETGVLSIETVPSQANIIVNNKLFGKSPKTEGGLIAGIYEVKVQKEGYKDWEKSLPIQAQYSTGYSAFLLFSQPKQDSQYTSPIYQNYVISSDKNSVFIPYISTDVTDKTPTPAKYFSIDIYKIDRQFWNFSQNPSITFKTPYSADIDYEINPSFNGESLFIKKLSTNAANNTKITTDAYIIKTISNTTPDKFDSLPLNSFYSTYNITWALNNKYLILESDSEIYSYNISTKSIVLLYKKTENKAKTVWQTDELGNFYVLEKAVIDIKDNELTTNRSYYRIERKELDGTNPIYLIDNIFYTTDNKGISDTKSNINVVEIPFTNSPFSTKFCGEIRDFEIKSELGAMISTDFGLYWYDIKSNKFTLADATKSELLSYSPSLNNFRFLYKDTEKDSLKVYTYYVEFSDHQNKIGVKTILEKVSQTKGLIDWFNITNYVSYISNDSLYLVDIDGENRNELIKLESNLDYLFNNQSNGVYLFKVEDIKSTTESQVNKTVSETTASTPITAATTSSNSMPNKSNLTLTKWLIH